jgi:hypothetical protein
MTSKDNLPAIFQVIENLLELKNRDLSKLSFDEIRSEWDSKIRRYLYFFYHAIQPVTTTHVFRARRITEDIIVPLDELGYPPPPVCYRNRCNWEGHPVLYTCSAPRTTLFECQPRVGDNYYVSSWKINNFSKITMLPLISNYHGVFPFMAKMKSRFFDDIGKYCDAHGIRFEEEKTMICLITDIFHDTGHFISSFLSHFYLYKYPGDNGPTSIVYPSIQTNKNDLNFAFHPSLVDDGSIELDHVIQCIVTSVTVDQISCDVIGAFGTISSGKLTWEHRSINELRKTEFGSMIRINP